MNIVRYDPFRDLRNLQDEMTRLFTGVAPSGGGREDMMNGAWSPRVDIFEDKDHLVLEAELPGMDQNDFELSFENNVLTLSGERKFESVWVSSTIASRLTSNITLIEACGSQSTTRTR